MRQLRLPPPSLTTMARAVGVDKVNETGRTCATTPLWSCQYWLTDWRSTRVGAGTFPRTLLKGDVATDKQLVPFLLKFLISSNFGPRQRGECKQKVDSCVKNDCLLILAALEPVWAGLAGTISASQWPLTTPWGGLVTRFYTKLSLHFVVGRKCYIIISEVTFLRPFRKFSWSNCPTKSLTSFYLCWRAWGSYRLWSKRFPEFLSQSTSIFCHNFGGVRKFPGLPPPPSWSKSEYQRAICLLYVRFIRQPFLPPIVPLGEAFKKEKKSVWKFRWY